jgi:hypothetical protein
MTTSALRKAEYSISKKNGQNSLLCCGNGAPRAVGGITNLRFLVRPRRLETRTERGFPHFHSNGGYCSLAHLKRQTLQNRGGHQILAQNAIFFRGLTLSLFTMAARGTGA